MTKTRVDGLLTPKEAALYLKLNPRTVVRLAREGKLPALKVGNRWRFESEALVGAARSAAREEAWGTTTVHPQEAPERLSLGSIVRTEFVVELEAADMQAVLAEMTNVLVERGVLNEPRQFLSLLLEREALMSTVIAEGIAVPHPRRTVQGMFRESLMVIGISRSGVDFGGGAAPVRLFLMICAKDDRSHLHILSRLSQVLNSTPVAQQLMAAGGPEEVVEAVRKAEGMAVLRRGPLVV